MSINSAALRIVFLLSGLFIIYTAFITILGTPESMGIQGQTDLKTYNEKYNHIRFLGGVWCGIGLLFIAATAILEKLILPIKFSIILIFLGGLFRFVDLNPDILLSGEIAGSLIAEIIGMPVLFFWLKTTVKPQ